MSASATKPTDAKQNYTWPTQDHTRLRLNAKHAPEKEWWLDPKFGENTPHLPHIESAKGKTEPWAQYDPSIQVKEYDFLLRDVLKVGELEGQVEGYTKENLAKIGDFKSMAADMYATRHEGDRDPVRMRVVSDEPGKRHIETFLTPAISDPETGLHRKFSDGKWTSIACTDTTLGGMGLPHAYSGAITEMMMSANPGYTVLELLGSGVIKAIESKGSDKLKQEWLPRLNSGKFSGAMVMTEIDYGSSLKDMETTVQLDANGEIGKVYGYKRFISSADHNATLGENGERNIVHMVLARTADKDGNLIGACAEKTDKKGNLLDPDGKPKLENGQPVKGKLTRLNSDGYILNPDSELKLKEGKPVKGKPLLTLVLVPRVLLDKDGHYVDENDNKVDKPDTNHVRAVKLNDKMGLEVQSNSDVAYDGAKGFIVGKVGEGQKNMFVIMNEARLGVGLQGTGIAEFVRQNIERYAAQERKQGPDGELINYPDVQDKILTMRAHIDAGRFIAAEVGKAFDEVAHSKPGHLTDEKKQELQKYIDVMTPLVKWGLTEGGYESINHGVMVMGGSGYMREWGIAQALSDSVISRIYEGANPLLAVAAAGSQIEKNMDVFISKVRKDMAELEKDTSAFAVDEANNFKQAISKPLDKAIDSFADATILMKKIGFQATKGKDEVAKQRFQAAAGHYMKLMYEVAAGTSLARSAHVARKKIKELGLDKATLTPEEQEQKSFYDNKIATAIYYANTVVAHDHQVLLNKMQENTQYLNLPDHGILQGFPTVFQKGAEMLLLGVLKGVRGISNFVEDAGTANGFRM